MKKAIVFGLVLLFLCQSVFAASIIQVRRDLAANWTATNPTLAQGEMGLETDTLKLKFGNGATAWNALGYYSTIGSIVDTNWQTSWGIFDANIRNYYSRITDTNGGIADINSQAKCSTDANSVLNSRGVCIALTGFHRDTTSSDANKAGAFDFNVIANPPWLKAVWTDINNFFARISDINGTYGKISDINGGIADINSQAKCSTDTNAVLNSRGVCISLTGFHTDTTSSDANKAGVFDYNVIANPPWLLAANEADPKFATFFDGNFYSKFVSPFDSNFYSKFKPAFDTNFISAFDRNFHTSFQNSFDGNFFDKFLIAFDGNWFLYFDRNFHAMFQTSFDGNFHKTFSNSFDGNLNVKFKDLFDSNFTGSFDGNFFRLLGLDRNFWKQIDLNHFIDQNLQSKASVTFGNVTSSNDVNANGNIEANGNYLCDNSACYLISDLNIVNPITASTGALAFSFYNTASSGVSDYNDANQNNGGYIAEQTIGHTHAASGQVQAAFIASDVNLLKIDNGHLNVHFHAQQTGGTKTIRLYAELYERPEDGTENLLATTEASNLLTGSSAAYDIHAAIPSFDLNVSDSLVIKIKGIVSGSGGDPVVSLFINGTTDSHLDIPINVIVLHNLLNGLQGGSTSERYHLTLAQQQSVIAIDSNVYLKITNTFDGNFYSKFLAPFDGNLNAKFKPLFDANFMAVFDGNLNTKFKGLFDSNFTRAFDGNFFNRFTLNFDGNFFSKFINPFDSNFTRAFDGNFFKRFKPAFDGNFQAAFDGNYNTRITADGNFLRLTTTQIVDGDKNFKKDLNITSGLNKGVSIKSDSNSICFGNNLHCIDFNGTTWTFT